MSENEPLSELRKTLQSLKVEGHSVVLIDGLLELLDGSTVVQPMQLETWKEACERDRLHYQLTHQAKSQERFELFKAVVTAGHAAVRSAILLNGGAAVAVLAFVGSLVQHGTPIHGFAGTLPHFAVGALFGSLASGGTYLAQSYYARNKAGIGKWWNLATMGCVTLSYLMFLVGCLMASSKL